MTLRLSTHTMVGQCYVDDRSDKVVNESCRYSFGGYTKALIEDKASSILGHLDDFQSCAGSSDD